MTARVYVNLPEGNGFECLWYLMTLWLRVLIVISAPWSQPFIFWRLKSIGHCKLWYYYIDIHSQLMLVIEIYKYNIYKWYTYCISYIYWLQKSICFPHKKKAWLWHLWLRWYFNFKIKCQEFDAGFVRPLEAVLHGTPLRTCYFCWSLEARNAARWVCGRSLDVEIVLDINWFNGMFFWRYIPWSPALT